MLIATMEPVAFAQYASVVVTTVRVNNPVKRPSPTTSSVVEGLVVPIPT